MSVAAMRATRFPIRKQTLIIENGFFYSSSFYIIANIELQAQCLNVSWVGGGGG